jgi:23S rRNA maturation-related 3'-5' exoribonuclease YhaM
VVSIAPRYDIRIVDAVQALDEDELPIAELNRRVGAVAEALGIPRPSYVHVRRYVIAERERRDGVKVRRDELRRIFLDVYADAMHGRLIDAYEVAERVREAGR